MTRKNIDSMSFCSWVFVGIGLFFTSVGIFMCSIFDTVATHLEGDMSPVAFIAIFLVIGLLFLFIGILLLRLQKQRVAENRWLVENNCYVLATIVDVIEDYSIVINGVPGFRAKCEYSDESTGLVHLFVSDVRTDGLKLFKIGKTVKVYLTEEGKYERYYVDLGK